MGRVNELLGFIVSVQGEVPGDNPNQNQHDQTNAFLSIVLPVKEAYEGTGEQQRSSDPGWRRGIFFGLFKKIVAIRFPFRGDPQEIHEDDGESKSDQWRNKQGQSHFLSFAPVDCCRD